MGGGEPGEVHGGGGGQAGRVKGDGGRELWIGVRTGSITTSVSVLKIKHDLLTDQDAENWTLQLLTIQK